MQAWRPALQGRAFASVFCGACPEAPWQVVTIWAILKDGGDDDH
jgi:hypothetical protein